jgi:hypothetical protein
MAAEPVTIFPFFQPHNGKEQIRLDFKGAAVQGNDPHALDPANYTLLKSGPGGAREIPLGGKPMGADFHGIHSIVLPLGGKIDTGKTAQYSLKINNTMTLKRDDDEAVAVPPNDYQLNTKAVALDATLLAPETNESKLQLQGGTGFGAISARYHLREDSVRDDLASDSVGDSWLHIDFTATADVDLDPDDKHDYLDSIVGELDAFHAYSWPDLESAKTLPAFMGHSEFGITSRVESDRDFKTVNSTAGASYDVFLKNPLTTWLHSVFVPNNAEAGVAPLFVLGYDYVGEIRRQEGTLRQGKNRLRGDFSWTLPLLQQFDIPLVGPRDVNAVFDLGGIYDFDRSRFTNTTQVSLEVAGNAREAGGWSWTLTYAQGRATPTYKHFDAILGGLKKLF